MQFSFGRIDGPQWGRCTVCYEVTDLVDDEIGPCKCVRDSEIISHSMIDAHDSPYFQELVADEK